MSAFGPKRTSIVAPHMSASEGKADMKIVTALSANQESERGMDTVREASADHFVSSG
jgi:hypothetical protein